MEHICSVSISRTSPKKLWMHAVMCRKLCVCVLVCGGHRDRERERQTVAKGGAWNKRRGKLYSAQLCSHCASPADSRAFAPCVHYPSTLQASPLLAQWAFWGSLGCCARQTFTFFSPCLFSSRHVLLNLPPSEALLDLLLLLSLGLQVLAVCPSACSCSRSHREVDCSYRGLRHLPEGLQHNVLSLNLSHNRVHNLDGQLTEYTHLRFLDLSHNLLSHMPTGLPRSLWHLYASSNRLQLLDKNDTVYQWNLRKLDLSNNKLERAVFINNTLTNLCTLNLSHNHFWTLPTNMPAHLNTIDLSHNSLVRVLPGSLDRLFKLTHFYLHANRFATLPFGALDKLTSLSVITLGNNPWACHLYDDISYLLSWAQQTSAHVLGCPCHTQPVCGGGHPGRTGAWHFATYNQPPVVASSQDLSSMTPEASVTGRRYWSVSSQRSKETGDTPHHVVTTMPISISTVHPRSTSTHLAITHLSPGAGPAAAERMFHTDSHHISGPLSDPSLITQTAHRADVTLALDHFFTTESPSIQTKKTTTLRTRSVRRQNQALPGGISSSSPTLPTCSSLPLLSQLGFLSLILQRFLWKTNEKPWQFGVTSAFELTHIRLCKLVVYCDGCTLAASAAKRLFTQQAYDKLSYFLLFRAWRDAIFMIICPEKSNVLQASNQMHWF